MRAGLAALRLVNLGVRFLLELGGLTAFAYWAATLRAPLALRAILAVAVPVAVGVIWSLFISPKARIPSGRLGRAGLGLIVFLAAAYALYVRGHGALAEPFAVTAAISSVIVYALPQ